MALQSTGAISLSQVAAELGVSATGIRLGAASVRTLAGKATGAVSLSNLYGKSNAPVITVTGTIVLAWAITGRNPANGIFTLANYLNFSGLAINGTAITTVSAPSHASFALGTGSPALWNSAGSAAPASGYTATISNAKGSAVITFTAQPGTQNAQAANTTTTNIPYKVVS